VGTLGIATYALMTLHVRAGLGRGLSGFERAIAHLHHRDMTMPCASRLLAKAEAYKRRMGSRFARAIPVVAATSLLPILTSVRSGIAFWAS
jgi:hypothetical protein